MSKLRSLFEFLKIFIFIFLGNPAQCEPRQLLPLWGRSYKTSSIGWGGCQNMILLNNKANSVKVMTKRGRRMVKNLKKIWRPLWTAPMQSLKIWINPLGTHLGNNIALKFCPWIAYEEKVAFVQLRRDSVIIYYRISLQMTLLLVIEQANVIHFKVTFTMLNCGYYGLGQY